jgi:hypothetical protein
MEPRHARILRDECSNRPEADNALLKQFGKFSPTVSQLTSYSVTLLRKFLRAVVPLERLS